MKIDYALHLLKPSGFTRGPCIKDWKFLQKVIKVMRRTVETMTTHRPCYGIRR